MPPPAVSLRMAPRSRRAVRAFTLLEVMIVLVIIVAIVGLVTVNLMGTRAEAQKDNVRIQLKSIQDALDLFNLTFSRYPTEEEGLAVLWNRSALSDEDQGRWRAFLRDPIPNDEWGSPWGYRAESESGRPYDLWSNGPDRQEGTEDDISVWRAAGDDLDSGGFDAPPPSRPR